MTSNTQKLIRNLGGRVLAEKKCNDMFNEVKLEYNERLSAIEKVLLLASFCRTQCHYIQVPLFILHSP